MTTAVAPVAGSPPEEKSKTPKFDALKGKQRRFVEEYMIDLNGGAAAIRAGYAESGAYVEAHRLLRNANIAEAVAELTTQRTGLTKAWIVDELAQDARTSMGDFARWTGNSVDLKDSAELPEELRRRVKKITRTWGKSNSLAIEIADRQAALFKLAEVFQLTKMPSDKGDTFNIEQAVFVRTPVASREEWEEQARKIAEERAKMDKGLIEGKAL